MCVSIGRREEALPLKQGIHGKASTTIDLAIVYATIRRVQQIYKILIRFSKILRRCWDGRKKMGRDKKKVARILL